MFRQPTLQKNALHEYLDNEDASAAPTDANTAAAGAGGAYTGAYTAAAGLGGQGGWGEAKSKPKSESGDEEQEEAEDDEMTVGRDGWIVPKRVGLQCVGGLLFEHAGWVCWGCRQGGVLIISYHLVFWLVLVNCTVLALCM